MHYNRLLADFRWHGDNLSAPNIECRDMDAELKRQKQHGEDAAIKRIYGLSFSKHSCNNIMDGFMREAYRMKKAFLYLTTPLGKVTRSFLLLPEKPLPSPFILPRKAQPRYGRAAAVITAAAPQ